MFLAHVIGLISFCTIKEPGYNMRSSPEGEGGGGRGGGGTRVDLVCVCAAQASKC